MPRHLADQAPRRRGSRTRTPPGRAPCSRAPSWRRWPRRPSPRRTTNGPRSRSRKRSRVIPPYLGPAFSSRSSRGSHPESRVAADRERPGGSVALHRPDGGVAPEDDPGRVFGGAVDQAPCRPGEELEGPTAPGAGSRSGDSGGRAKAAGTTAIGPAAPLARSDFSGVTAPPPDCFREGDDLLPTEAFGERRFACDDRAWRWRR